jgi:sugar-specific transcriptional regulator TrmB
MEQDLKKFGLTEYEIKVYMALLSEGAKKGGEVSKLSKVPHGKTYEALLSLAEKGFVSILPVKPKVFTAINPALAVKHYSSVKMDDMKKLEKEIIEKLELIKTLPKEAPKAADKLTIVHGMKNERNLSKHTYDIAKKYVKNMSTYEFVSSNAREEARKRGIKIFQIATREMQNLKKNAKEELKKGVPVKYFPFEELRLKIIDGDKAVLTIINPENPKDKLGVFIESKEFAHAMEYYYDMVWKKAKKI